MLLPNYETAGLGGYRKALTTSSPHLTWRSAPGPTLLYSRLANCPTQCLWLRPLPFVGSLEIFRTNTRWPEVNLEVAPSFALPVPVGKEPLPSQPPFSAAHTSRPSVALLRLSAKRPFDSPPFPSSFSIAIAMGRPGNGYTHTHSWGRQRPAPSP